MSQRVTRTSLRNLCDHLAFLSHFEPKIVNKALNDESSFFAMQDKLHQFERNQLPTIHIEST